MIYSVDQGGHSGTTVNETAQGSNISYSIVILYILFKI